MRINPIIPIWLMAIICVVLILIKRRGFFPFLRQIIMVALLFAINLRIVIPGETGRAIKLESNQYVIFVIDDTISMLAQDGEGSMDRLTVLKGDCKRLMDHHENAKYAVITFDAYAKYMCPFTDDQRAAENTVHGLYPVREIYANGTSLNTSKAEMKRCLERIQDKATGGVVVYFMSDGENTNKDKLESFAELSQYVTTGAVIGYGTKEGAKMYMEDYWTGEVEVITNYKGEEAISKLDEDNLQAIASDMGIPYVHRDNTASIDTVTNVVDKALSNLSVEQTETEEKEIDYVKDIYMWFAIPLLAMLFIEAIIFIIKR